MRMRLTFSVLPFPCGAITAFCIPRKPESLTRTQEEDA